MPWPRFSMTECEPWGPTALLGITFRDVKEKKKMNKQDSSSLEIYDSRPSHKASDKIWLDPSGIIVLAAFCLNRHIPHVQNNLENSFWLLSCVPASPVCFGLWSVTQRKETHAARRLHTEEGDACNTQVAHRGKRRTRHAGCPHLWVRLRPGCAPALLVTWNSPLCSH